MFVESLITKTCPHESEMIKSGQRFQIQIQIYFIIP